MNGGGLGLYQRGGKRALDILLASLCLVLWSPLVIPLAVAVRVLIGSPILYRQRRPGLNGREFTLFKFRTMTETRAEDGSLLPDDRRLTRFGRMLRALSLDEVPELFNVLKGEMSLVGPRPLLTAYLPRYTPDQARRHLVRPGITGWAQVNGRNNTTWEQRFRLDTWYVDNLSLALDLKILVMTLRTVVRRDGISADGHATMPEFTGPPSADAAHSSGRKPSHAAATTVPPSAGCVNGPRIGR
ncbi:MAG: sugar transferase [Bacteroidales bacterium]